jgi:hypothetical protein
MVKGQYRSYCKMNQKEGIRERPRLGWMDVVEREK